MALVKREGVVDLEGGLGQGLGWQGPLVLQPQALLHLQQRQHAVHLLLALHRLAPKCDTSKIRISNSTGI